MSQADRYLQSILEDLDQISGRIEKVRLGKVRKVDCFTAALPGLQAQIRTLKATVTLAIIPSED